MSLRPLKRMMTWLRPQQQQQQSLWPQISLLELPTELQNVILLEAIVVTSRDSGVYVEDVVTSLCLVCRRWWSMIDCRGFDRQLRRQLAYRNPTFRYRIEVKQFSSIDDKPLPKNRVTCVHDGFLFALRDCQTVVDVYKLYMKNRVSRHIGSVDLFETDDLANSCQTHPLQACTAEDGSLQLYSKTYVYGAVIWHYIVSRTTILYNSQRDTVQVDLESSAAWMITDWRAMKVNAANGDIVLCNMDDCVAEVYNRDGVRRMTIDLNPLMTLIPRDSWIDVVPLPADGPDTYVVRALHFRPPAARGFWRSAWQLVTMDFVKFWPIRHLSLVKIRQSTGALEILSDVREFAGCDQPPMETTDPNCPLLLADLTQFYARRKGSQWTLTLRRVDADFNVLPGIGVMHVSPCDFELLRSLPMFDPKSKSFFE